MFQASWQASLGLALNLCGLTLCGLTQGTLPVLWLIG
jgi:hypothetical protein